MKLLQKDKILITALILAVFFSTNLFAEQETYINTEFGFEITGPDGWYKQELTKGQRELIHAGAQFTKTEGENLPSIDVSVDLIKPVHRGKIKSALDFTKFMLSQYDQPGIEAKIQLVEPPQEVDVKGLVASKVVFDVSGPKGTLRMADYKFMKGDLLISILCVDYPGTFEYNFKDLESVIKSFKFR